MSVNVDGMIAGAWIRIENGIAVAAHQVFHRAIDGNADPLVTWKDDMTLPQPFDSLAPDRFPNLVVVNQYAHVVGAGSPGGKATIAIEFDYVYIDTLNQTGGTGTATILSSFDSSGNRIVVTDPATSTNYVGQTEIEEARPFKNISMVITGDPDVIQQSIVNKVNDADWPTDSASPLHNKCWRVVRDEYVPIKLTDDPATSIYRHQFYVEGIPQHDIHLSPTGSATTVYGQQRVEALSINGAIPADAVFVVIDVYATADFASFFGF